MATVPVCCLCILQDGQVAVNLVLSSLLPLDPSY